MEVSGEFQDSFLDVSEVTVETGAFEPTEPERPGPSREPSTSTPGPSRGPLTSTPIKRRRHLCFECGKTYTTKTNLAEHMRFEHTAAPRYTCNVCEKSFMKKEVYESHCNDHAGIKPHVCQKCRKSYVNRRGLTRHACRAAVETHECPTCQKRFRSAKQLSQHQHVHDATPQFLCSKCHAKFKQRQSLRRHEASRCRMARNQSS